MSKLVFGIFLAALIGFLVQFDEWELRYKTGRTVTVSEPQSYDVHSVKVAPRDNEGGGMHGRIFQLPFKQAGRTSGRSPSVLSIQFEKAVEIHGIVASVDCWKSTRLVEFAGGLNQTPAYQTNGPNEMLFHVSFATNTTAGKIDEQFWFKEPFLASTDDLLNIGAWIQNISGAESSVSPEFIIYFKWK